MNSVLVGVLLGMAAGCAAPRGVPSEGVPAVSSPPSFVRSVAPFEVRDATGASYAHPFLGGLNVPRPQFVDIDADGDLDLFVQEVTGQIMFFEQVGTPAQPHLVWRTDRYANLDVGEWYRFADLDADGDADLLAEERFSYVRYYRNDGTPGEAAFTLVADTLKDATGDPIFSDRQNIPNVTDLDCDGRLDLFIGRVTGTVMRYEEAGRDAAGLPRFQFVTDRFENIEIIGQIGTLHGANTLTFADYDRDGDPDLFWGDFFEPGLLLIENTGSCTAPSLQGAPTPFPREDPLRTSGYNAPVFADYDRDGDDDLFVGVLGGAFNPNLTAKDNLYHYEQTDAGRFTVRARRFLTGIDVGNESIPAFADLDADGDFDLLLANKIDPERLETSLVYHFENQGTPAAPAFQLVGVLPLEPAFHAAPALADLDADGDLDLMLGTWNDGVAFYRNEGTPQAPVFVAEALGYVQLTRGSNSTPALVDLDADGDFDLFVGESSGELNFYRNEGTPQTPAFVLVDDVYGGLDVGRRSAPAFVDLDADGDFDLVVGREADGLAFFRNEGTPQAAAFVPDSTLSLAVPNFSTPAFADLDGDGDADFFSGGVGGGMVYYENRQRSPGGR